ncbi:hypothetical protein AA0472_2892 [Acetobacter estunensis NRIC 0472]|nr:hypothetical protein AA0472_2892 [Acetobacter estunensis NRIC 0472]
MLRQIVTRGFKSPQDRSVACLARKDATTSHKNNQRHDQTDSRGATRHDVPKLSNSCAASPKAPNPLDR